MRVLVTGASGFIGRNVLLRVPREWDVFAVYHSTPGLEMFAAAHGLANVSALRCDLTSPDDVAGLLRRTGPVDICLHLAANGDPTKSSEQPALDLRQNTLALVTLLEQLRVNHFVYVSSGAVYDRLTGDVTPDTPVAPRVPYAISKLASEYYLRAFAERSRTVGSYVIVRFFGAYGPFEPPRKITTRWMHAIMNGQREFTVRGNGENLIDFMYVDDAVEAFLRLMRASGFSGTVDLASGEPVTINEVVATLSRVLGVEAVIRHEGRTEEYIQFRSVDRAMRHRFGFVPAVPVEEGVRRLHQHLLQEARDARQPA
jgi:nucleoside-diphosphate-sugar epimerase